MKPIWGIFALVVTISFAPVTTASESTETIVWGEEVSWVHFVKGQEFYVRIFDSVKDGCWTNTKAVKTVVELELKRSGYKLTDEMSGYPILVNVGSTGYAINDGSGCVVAYELDIQRVVTDIFFSGQHKLKSFVPASIWANSGVMSGQKNNSNSRLKEKYVEMIQSFLIGIDAEQKTVLDAIAKNEDASPEAKAYWANYEID